MADRADLPYRITIDKARGLLRLDLFGFWDQNVAKIFDCDFRSGVRALGLPPGQHLMLTDARQFEVQSVQITTALQSLVKDPAMQARRMAVLFNRALVRMQGMRQVAEIKADFFVDEDEAFAWLLSKDELPET